MQYFFQFVFLLSTLFAVNSESETRYVFEENKNGIDIFSKVDNQTGFKWFKLETQINAPVEDITTYTRSIPNIPEWVYGTSKSDIISENDSIAIYTVITDLPFPMTDRISVIKKKTMIDYEKKIMRTISTIDSDHIVDTDLVKVPRLHALWTFEAVDDRTTKVIHEISADAGGSVPAWVTDSFASKGPYNTINNLKTKFEK